MAISKTHYEILRELRQRGVLPLGKPVLEIGQATYYGDMDPAVLFADIARFAHEEDREACRVLYRQAYDAVDMLAMARLIYRVLFWSGAVNSIDPSGSGAGNRNIDLNEPLDPVLIGQYSTVINHGTAEHVFNIANVFRVMHDACNDGGLMLHESPFTGWVNHGFYCLQPTLFYDVAKANCYEIVGVWLEHMRSQTYYEIDSHEQILDMARRDQLPNNSMLFVTYRKRGNKPFKYPQQAVYSNGSDAVKSAWMDLR